MNFESRKEKQKLISKLIEKIENNNFDEYFKGFIKVPFALYDNYEVYLINHPTPPKSFSYNSDSVYISNWTNEYVGNTAIKINDIYTAIWDINTLNEIIDVDKLYANIVHEMYHANQLKNNDNRFANEMDFINYSFTKEFIELRINERYVLFNFIFEDDLHRKIELVSDFIRLREKRKNIIGQAIKYEFAIESIEGTATYVEYKALLKETKLPKTYLLSYYGQKLIESDDLKLFRASCYYSGLFISLVLDEFYPDWQISYNESDQYLYEYFINLFKQMELEYQKDIKLKDVSYYSEFLLKDYFEGKKKLIDTFNNSEGYRVILEGKLKLTGFDPMNIVDLDGTILHKNFISCNNIIFIKGMVLSIHDDDNIWNIKELHFYCNKQPTVCNNTIYIKNIGQFKGEIDILDKNYRVKIYTSTYTE